MLEAKTQNSQRRHKVSKSGRRCWVGQVVMMLDVRSYNTNYTKEAQSFTKEEHVLIC
jgi:hypothetical protein